MTVAKVYALRLWEKQNVWYKSEKVLRISLTGQKGLPYKISVSRWSAFFGGATRLTVDNGIPATVEPFVPKPHPLEAENARLRAAIEEAIEALEPVERRITQTVNGRLVDTKPFRAAYLRNLATIASKLRSLLEDK